MRSKYKNKFEDIYLLKIMKQMSLNQFVRAIQTKYGERNLLTNFMKENLRQQ